MWRRTVTVVLRRLIEDLRQDEETISPQFPTKYDRLKAAVPSLHFMSLTVFTDPQYDPILVMECNFDGAAGPFFAQLEDAYGPRLRDMLRCCKVPPAPIADRFNDVVAAGSRAPIAPLLEALVVLPAVFHQGNRGMARERILRERALFCAARSEIDTNIAYRDEDIITVHRMLRARMLQQFPWLAASETPLIPSAEDRADKLRLIGFLILGVLALIAPGVVLGLALPLWVTGFLLTGALVWAAMKVDWLRELDADLDSPVSHWLMRAAVILPVGGVLISLLPRHDLWRVLTLVLSGVGGVIPTVVLILLWLRTLERRDPSLDAPVQDARVLQELANSEDQINQNHMISIVHIKPGLLRAVLIRAGLWGLGAILRVQTGARSGYLASMRTIHFAHWALLSNGGRLMFHSNFDGTWESYLDDFIEKAHAGLTLAWSSSVGFPPTRFLVLDGATRGGRFKNWARHSMTPSLFWFSAYRDLSVNQIERQRRVADGLRMSEMSREEAEAWALDL